jgi:hypothetical protein
MGGMTDFWKGLDGAAVLRPPGRDSTSGRCLLKPGVGLRILRTRFVTGAGALGLLVRTRTAGTATRHVG